MSHMADFFQDGSVECQIRRKPTDKIDDFNSEDSDDPPSMAESCLKSSVKYSDYITKYIFSRNKVDVAMTEKVEDILVSEGSKDRRCTF